MKRKSTPMKSMRLSSFREKKHQKVGLGSSNGRSNSKDKSTLWDINTLMTSFLIFAQTSAFQQREDANGQECASKTDRHLFLDLSKLYAVILSI